MSGNIITRERITRFAAASDKVYQLLALGRWFSPGTTLPPPLKLVAMIYIFLAEVLLKMALKHQKSSPKNHHQEGIYTLTERWLLNKKNQ